MLSLATVHSFNDKGLIYIDNGMLYNINNHRDVRLREHIYDDPNCQFIVISSFKNMMNAICRLIAFKKNPKDYEPSIDYEQHRPEAIRLALEYIHDNLSTLNYFTLLKSYEFLDEFEAIAKDYFDIVTKTEPITTNQSYQIHYLLKWKPSKSYKSFPNKRIGEHVNVLIDENEETLIRNYYFTHQGIDCCFNLSKYKTKPFNWYVSNSIDNIRITKKYINPQSIKTELEKIEILRNADSDIEKYKSDALNYEQFLNWIKNKR
jgi:hypothetical protein